MRGKSHFSIVQVHFWSQQKEAHASCAHASKHHVQICQGPANPNYSFTHLWRLALVASFQPTLPLTNLNESLRHAGVGANLFSGGVDGAAHKKRN